MTCIRIQPEWYNYIIKNQEILRGWIQYNLITYLQRRNPNVPGISSKLDPPLTRKLRLITRYWKIIMDIIPVYDIYGNERLTEKNISIDHFVPWSYVAYDELWNLHPTTKSINSSKSNYLPDWNKYFQALCKIEYLSYQLVWKYEVIRNEFEKCKKEHVNSNDVLLKLYKPNLSLDQFGVSLENILAPVYKAARNSGFKIWTP